MQRAVAAFAAPCLLGLILAAASPIAAPSAVADPSRAPAPASASGPAAATSAAPTPVVDGLDVSDHQKRIDWARVAAAGKQFAFIRASAGTLTADRAYGTNVAAARGAGLVVGSYHFANPNRSQDDAQREARWFLAHATILSGDLRPVLDLERANGLDPVELISWARTWLETVTEATGVRPLIYASPVFWLRATANTDWFAQNGYPLWIAHWTPDGGPAVPGGNWHDAGWAVWQHTSHGAVPGIPGRVDLDRVAGSSLPASILVP
ncbi:MAG TPA: glycoside hydrolase family 25 protein [Candidatus Limnocylindrales bacterium]|nr:glycoside hydrolase family 25 protein [Candidatus Limnocylindrales bacterium]